MKHFGNVSLMRIAIAAVLSLSGFAHAQRGPASQPALDPNLRTIFIASDSTAASGTRGWGAHLPTYIDKAKINIVNGARGGQSSRTFISAGSWKAIADRVKKSDIVLIQFGHNDITDVKINDPIRQRGVIRYKNFVRPIFECGLRYRIHT